MCVCASTRHGAGREARACALRSKVRKCCARTHTYVKHEHGHEHEHARQVRKLMLKHERDLRLGIRKILVQHGEGCDQPTAKKRCRRDPLVKLEPRRSARRATLPAPA